MCAVLQLPTLAREVAAAAELIAAAGRVELPAGHDSPARPPFLWDTASMPDRATSCAHCDPNQRPPLCCGVCVFEGRRCDALYPGEGRSEAVVQHLLDSGYRLKVGSGGRLGWCGRKTWVGAVHGGGAWAKGRWVAEKALDGQQLLPHSHRLVPRPQDMSPCELFARIRGRTLWFMGDSQTW